MTRRPGIVSAPFVALCKAGPSVREPWRTVVRRLLGQAEQRLASEYGARRRPRDAGGTLSFAHPSQGVSLNSLGRFTCASDGRLLTVACIERSSGWRRRYLDAVLGR